MHRYGDPGQQGRTVAVLDYGMGNLGSVVNMLKKVGARAVVTADRDEIMRSDRLVLPGVGAFDRAMQNLQALGLTATLDEAVLVRRKPILGLCLGMQLLGEGSEEGTRPGLGWLRGRAVRFRFDAQEPDLKVPHMGWNRVHPRTESPLFRMRDDRPPRFYFAHSYHLLPEDDTDVLAESEYGYPFVAAVQRGNITGVQFHPEKSHRFGFDLLSNFVADGAGPGREEP